MWFRQSKTPINAEIGNPTGILRDYRQEDERGSPLATRRNTPSAPKGQTADYLHSQEATQRPDVGVQDQFSTKKAPKTYRYDSSLDPALSWDENRDRDLSEWLIGLVQRSATEGEAAVFTQAQVWAGGGVQVQSLKAAAGLLAGLSQPFLNWTGKAERNLRGSEPLAVARDQIGKLNAYQRRLSDHL